MTKEGSRIKSKRKIDNYTYQDFMHIQVQEVR